MRKWGGTATLALSEPSNALTYMRETTVRSVLEDSLARSEELANVIAEVGAGSCAWAREQFESDYVLVTASTTPGGDL